MCITEDFSIKALVNERDFFSEGNHGSYDLCIIYETDIAEELHNFGFDRQIK